MGILSTTTRLARKCLLAVLKLDFIANLLQVSESSTLLEEQHTLEHTLDGLLGLAED